MLEEKMMTNTHLTLEQKMQIILRIKLGYTDRQIASEFNKSRSRITQIKLYEQEEIQEEWRLHIIQVLQVKAIDKIITNIGEEN